MNIDDIYKVLKEDLGQDPKEIFEDFDEKPLGTASLAQVHKAKLKVRKSQKKIVISSILPKNLRHFSPNFCPSAIKKD